MLRRFRLLLLLAPLAALAACAPLPDVAALIASAAGGRAPEVIGVHGPHPAQRAHEVLQRLLAAGPAPGMLKEHLPVAAAISNAPRAAGNRAMLLTSGPAIERAILDATANARNNIDIETYIIADDDAGRRLADLLLRKRAEHVVVNLIYDGLASRATPPAYFERLRQAGVRTLEFNPINPLGARVAWSPNRRDHRKVFIVDGSVAILGGANVELILPSFSDFPPALAAGRAHYERLLAAGAMIYERQHAWLHAKTAVIDGVWSTVGSTNLDRRSFLFNQEVNAMMLGPQFAQRMEQAFARDRAASRRIAAGAWHDRPVSQRAMEWIADLFGYWW